MLEIGSDQISEMLAIVKPLAAACKVVGNGWGGYLCIICHKDKVQSVV